MFSQLKKFIFGDKRPVVRSIAHPVIGTLTYSDDDEAWLTDPKASPCGFGFYISGDWKAAGPEILPASALVQHAEVIGADPETFLRSVQEFIDAQLHFVHSLAGHRDEIEKLRVYQVALMWPDRPADGEIELRASFDSHRIWHCAYIEGKPAPYLNFTGLDQ